MDAMAHHKAVAAVTSGVVLNDAAASVQVDVQRMCGQAGDAFTSEHMGMLVAGHVGACVGVGMCGVPMCGRPREW